MATDKQIEAGEVPLSTLIDELQDVAIEQDCTYLGGLRINGLCSAVCVRLEEMQKAINIAYGHLWEEENSTWRTMRARKSLAAWMEEEDMAQGIKMAREAAEKAGE